MSHQTFLDEARLGELRCAERCPSGSGRGSWKRDNHSADVDHTRRLPTSCQSASASKSKRTHTRARLSPQTRKAGSVEGTLRTPCALARGAVSCYEVCRGASAEDRCSAAALFFSARRQQHVLLRKQRSCSSEVTGGVFFIQKTWYIGSPFITSLAGNQRSR